MISIAELAAYIPCPLSYITFYFSELGCADPARSRNAIKSRRESVDTQRKRSGESISDSITSSLWTPTRPKFKYSRGKLFLAGAEEADGICDERGEYITEQEAVQW